MTNILVVDDDIDIRELVQLVLSRSGYEVHSECDGESGLAAARDLRPDLILLDWMMPKLTGVEVCQQLVEAPSTAGIPVIMLTARAQQADVQMAYTAGATDFIVKPFSPRELASRVKDLLERKSQQATEEPPAGRLYDVAGRNLMLHKSGTGGPAVVFLPGAGLVGLDFLLVAERAAELTTTVVYDRGGTGWSDPVDLPRTAAEVTSELRELLQAAEVASPYILAGHSLGAFYGRQYAQRFPDEVAGLLLLDPGHEDVALYMPEKATEMNRRMKLDPERMPEPTEEQIQSSRDQLGRLYAQWPESVRGPLIERHLASWWTGVQETTNYEGQVYEELRAGPRLPDVPLIVLSAGGPNLFWAQFMTDELMGEALDGVRALHAAIASSVPRGEQRLLEGVSHQYLHVEGADSVVQAISDLVQRTGI
jgi:CheY-like chemotaxis protein/pimeloyl-ACP methyl ester carboxylesterase